MEQHTSYDLMAEWTVNYRLFVEARQSGNFVTGKSWLLPITIEDSKA